MEQPLLYTGQGAIVAMIVLALYYGTAAIREWRGARRDGQHSKASDSAALIAGYQTALREEREENASLRARQDELEHQVDELRDAQGEMRELYEARIEQLHRERAEQRAHYEREITKLRDQVVEVTRRLDTLRQQLHPDEESPL